MHMDKLWLENNYGPGQHLSDLPVMHVSIFIKATWLDFVIQKMSKNGQKLQVLTNRPGSDWKL